ncbi:MAG: molybdenum cofactor biosynthesis protein MoaE [Bacillota bacterium]
MANKTTPPSIDQWLREAKADPAAAKVGMFLTHNGIVRQTPKAKVREGLDDGKAVKGLEFYYDAKKVEAVIEETCKLEGIFYVKAWLNEGQLEVGDDIMYVLIGGDIRPHVVDALQFMVGKIKTECVTEIEQY